MDKLDKFLFRFDYSGWHLPLFLLGSNVCWRRKYRWATVKSANSWSEPGLNEDEQLNILSLQ